MEIGARVRYIHFNNDRDKATGCYPPVGTLGTVVAAYNGGIMVQWDEGTKGDGKWYCLYCDVERISTDT